jgi:hypothetical protein
LTFRFTKMPANILQHATAGSFTFTRNDHYIFRINTYSLILKQKVLESDYVQADQTTIKVLDRDKKSGPPDVIW